MSIGLLIIFREGNFAAILCVLNDEMGRRGFSGLFYPVTICNRRALIETGFHCLYASLKE